MNKASYTLSMLKLLVKNWTMFSLILLAAGVVWIAWTASQIPAEQSKMKAYPHKGFPPPDFTLRTQTGDEIHLADLLGKPILLNFWASWCPPCRAEMPILEKISEEYNSANLVVLAVNTTYQDTTEGATRFMNEFSPPLLFLWDMKGDVSHAYQITALPTTFFIGSEGLITDVVIGGPISEALLRVHIENLIEASSP